MKSLTGYNAKDLITNLQGKLQFAFRAKVKSVGPTITQDCDAFFVLLQRIALKFQQTR